MNRLHGVLIASGAVLLGAFAILLQPPAAPPPSGDFVIREVKLFDGERFVAGNDVLVRAGRIAAVGVDLALPADLPVVEGDGGTLLPGLIDAHVHSFGEARRDALRFGVTALIDMFSDPRGLPTTRAERDGMSNADQADLWSAGMLATAPGGHGTQYPTKVVPVENAAQAADWVAARRAEGSDFIKLVREDMHVYPGAGHRPSLDDETAAALISAAHAQGLRAVAHASAMADARQSLTDGADGLVHVFQDEIADAEIVALAKARAAFVIPTLSVIASIAHSAHEVVDDARLAPWLSPAQHELLAAPMHPGPAHPQLLANAVASVRALHAAGVPILAGTDATNPGTAQGASLHEEIARLADAGLDSSAALAAATSAPADAFGLAERGRIRVGYRADLLLIDGDPEQDIRATRAIRTIWKNGQAVDRAVDASTSTPTRLAAGMIGAFDSTDAAPTAQWLPTSDRMAGGQSEASFEHSSGGAQSSAGALRVHGEVRGDGPQVWAGAYFNPGAQPMSPVDASGLQELRLQIRGDGRELNLLLFSGESGRAPASLRIRAGAQWAEQRLPLSGFAGVDLSRLRGLAITASKPAGPFWFELDQVEIR